MVFPGNYMDDIQHAMQNDYVAWDQDYQKRGALWSGTVHYLPVMPPTSKVLELGCGNGKNLPSMIQRNWEVTAIDFSPCAVKMCKTTIDSAHNGSICVADVRCLPFVSEIFDGVIATHVFSHMVQSERQVAVSEASRLLKKGGMLYFSGFSHEDFRSVKGEVVEPGTTRNNQGICTHYFTEPEIQDLFSSLTLQSMTTKRWSMRVRGHDFPRAEIQAVFTR